MAGSKDVRAGRGFVELFAEDNKLYRALDRAAARLKAWGATVAKIGTGLGAAGGVLLGPLTKFLSDAANRGSNLQQLSRETGATVESLSALEGAFAQVGADGDDFASAIGALQGRIRGAADANGELVEGLRGLNGRVLMGQNLDSQLDAIADKFSTITNASDRAAVAQDLFGASGAKLLPFLARGRAGLEELRKAGLASGAAMSSADAARGEAIAKALTQGWAAVKFTLLDVGASLLPIGDGVGDVGDRFKSALATVRGWVAENRGLIQVGALVAAGLVGGGVALIGFGVALSVAGTAIGLVVAGMKLLAGTVLMFGLPFAVFAASVGGLGYLWATQTEAGQRWASETGAALTSVADTAKTTFGGITDALKAGDWQLAGRIGIAGLKSAWAEGVLYFTQQWNHFKGYFVDGFHDATTGLALAWNDFDAWFGDKIIALVQWFNTNFGGGLRKTFGFLAGALEAVGLTDEAKAFNTLATSGVSQLNAALVATRNNIGAQREAIEREIVDQARDEQIARNASREADMAGAREDARAAREELDRLRGEAGAAAGRGARGIGPGLAEQIGLGIGERIAANLAGRLPGQPQLFASAKGTFAGPVGMQLRYGDNTAKRQLDATLGVRDNTRNAVVAIEGVGGAVNELAAGLRFQ